MLQRKYISDVMAANNYLPLHEAGAASDRDDVIKMYFDLGVGYSDILRFLALYHDMELSLRQLSRILRRLSLQRRNLKDNFHTIVDLVEQELAGSGRDLGYRSMHDRLRKIHHVFTDRESVRLILKHMDPDGVEMRRQRRLRRRSYRVPGPNYIWHVDGWDKLKQYGFPVHGCIDGYSRRIIWLQVASTNNDPYVICRYFADTVGEMKAVPKIVRADRGTENVHIETMQTFLRSAHHDNRALQNTTFMYGRSTANQRIECWWSKFGQQGMSFWISHFQEMSEIGIIDLSDELHIECCRFCYMPLFSAELQDIMMMWNTHYIRKSRNEHVPHGRPDVIYYMPEQFGGIDYQYRVDDTEVAAISEILTVPPPMCQEEYSELFELLMLDRNIVAYPSTVEEADDLLVNLLDSVDDYYARM
jgi:hypothetical protein